jgi:hypothetical protein
MLNRRKFIAAAGTLGAASMPQAQMRAAAAAFDGDQKREHYHLSGKRLVFTNWYFVRPGHFTWVDKGGKKVFASRDALGPMDAQFQPHDFPYGVRLAAERAQRLGPLLSPEHPWEQTGISFGTVIQEAGMYRAWGACLPSGPDSIPAYFESQDGLHWKRPKLGIREQQGSRSNNLLEDPLGSVFIDPAAPAAERYKWVRHRAFSRAVFEAYLKRRPGEWHPMTLDNDSDDRFHAAEGAVSADGLRWKVLPEPLVFEPTDTQLVCYHDARRAKYVLYTRNYMGAGPSARRAIGRSESADFRNMPVSRVVIETSPEMSPADTLYTNCRTTVPGAPDHHLMFPAVYRLAADTTNIAFASSHDGEVWNFVPGSPIAEPGNFGEWDGGCMFAHPDLLELPDGRFALPYTGYAFPHKYPRGAWKVGAGYLVWPKGRLVALEAQDRGEFATVGLLAPGRKVMINAVTERAGEILAEVADHEGKTIPGRGFAECMPVIGDHYRTMLVWSGREDLDYRENAPVILRFRLRHARIYGLEFV